MPAVKRQQRQLTGKEEEILGEHYYSVRSPGSYGSVKTLSNATKLSPRLVKEWLKNQTTYTLHRYARKRFPRRKYMTRKMDFQHQADLVEMIPYAEENSGYRYMITVIDIFSRFAWAEPLRRKTAEETAKVIEKIYSANGRIPKLLQTDAGKEFENRPVRSYLATIDVEQFSIASPMKAAIVERFNRTLKEKMWKVFTRRGSYEWLTILPDLLHSYNNSAHRSLRNRTPASINRDNESEVWLELYGGREKVKKRPKFSIGDRVKLSKAKQIFEKGYLPKWTEEEFFINSVNRKFFPVMYEIRDHKNEIIRGNFYEEELQAVINKDNVYRIEKVIRVRGQGDQKEALVKWRGYRDPEWIPHKNIVKNDQL